MTLEELKSIAGIVDIPIAAASLIWALRTVQAMHGEVIEILKKCMEKLE